MVTTESVTIKVPVGMSKYLVTMNPETELTRNALLLYPYILNQTISHGRAAEILGIRKSELIDLYDKLGYFYFDMTMDEAKGRNVSAQMGLRIMGTIGILMAVYEEHELIEGGMKNYCLQRAL